MATIRLRNSSKSTVKAGQLVRVDPKNFGAFSVVEVNNSPIIGTVNSNTLPGCIATITLIGTADSVAGGNGKSAYEIAVDNGFSGTEEEWLASLVGRNGYTPIKDVDYFDGVKGDKGDRGDQGIQGLPGSDATVTKSAVESVLTGEISSHTHASSGGLTQAQILTRQL